MSDEEMLSVPEAASYTGLAEDRILEAINRGEFEADHDGLGLLVSRWTLDNWVREGKRHLQPHTRNDPLIFTPQERERQAAAVEPDVDEGAQHAVLDGIRHFMLFWQAPPTQQQLEQLPGVTRSAIERLLRQGYITKAC